MKPSFHPVPSRRTWGFALALITVLAAGCATTQTRWYLNGRTEADFHGHDAHCSSQANQAVSGQNLNQAGYYMGSGGQWARLGFMMAALEVGGVAARYSACMQSLGYTKAP